jgi:hypothetical protein
MAPVIWPAGPGGFPLLFYQGNWVAKTERIAPLEVVGRPGWGRVSLGLCRVFNKNQEACHHLYTKGMGLPKQAAIASPRR